MKHKSRGFTLVEIMVASIIGAFIAVVAVGTLRAVSDGSQMVNATIDRAAEVRFASKKIAGVPPKCHAAKPGLSRCD